MEELVELDHVDVVSGVFPDKCSFSRASCANFKKKNEEEYSIISLITVLRYSGDLKLINHEGTNFKYNCELMNNCTH